VKEKLLAAHRAGIRTVILPRDNEKDLADVPPEIKEEFTIHFVETMDEVLKLALTRDPEPIKEDLGAETGFRPYMEKDPGVRPDPVTH
jgi:ATP-dependent Lon protease